MNDQPALPLTPPTRCLRCLGTGDVYHRQYLSGHIVIGGKRITCPECRGSGWVGQFEREGNLQ